MTEKTVEKEAEKAKVVKKAGEPKAKAGLKAVETIVIDADGCTMGRLAAHAAKEAIRGKKVVIFNAEKVIISGKQDYIFKDYKRRYDAISQSNPWRYGPHRPKNPDRFLRRVVRGMLPYKKAKGEAAFKRVMVYMGKPEREIMKSEHIDITKVALADVSSLRKHYDYFIRLGDLCAYLGGKNE